MFEIKHPQHRHFSREERINQHRQSGVSSYFVIATVRGQSMVWGPYKTYAEAERVGSQKTSGYFEVKKGTSSDLAEMTREMREQDIEENGLRPESFRRFGHR